MTDEATLTAELETLRHQLEALVKELIKHIGNNNQSQISYISLRIRMAKRRKEMIEQSLGIPKQVQNWETLLEAITTPKENQPNASR